VSLRQALFSFKELKVLFGAAPGSGQNNICYIQSRHPGESRDPEFLSECIYWIPAFAGMTNPDLKLVT
jgi:hypothetical protein